MTVQGGTNLVQDGTRRPGRDRAATLLIAAGGLLTLVWTAALLGAAWQLTVEVSGLVSAP